MTDGSTGILPGMDASVDNRLVVALDGPGSSGKSSVGAAAALDVGYRFCDTGLLYRAVTWLAIARGLTASHPHAMRGLVDEVDLAADAQGRLARVYVDGIDHTEDVRSPEVDVAVSAISAIPELRAALLERQRTLAADGGIIMAGRDIGTVVLPDADLKIFLDASVEERARRRTRERDLDPAGPEAVEILEALRRRDKLEFDPRRRPAPDGGRRPDHLHRRQPVRGHGRRSDRRDPRRRGTTCGCTRGQLTCPTIPSTARSRR